MKAQSLLRSAPLWAATCLLAACAQPAYVPDELADEPLDVRFYRQAASEGRTVYEVNPNLSRVYVRVGRDGPMKSAGHDHLVASEHVEGMILLDGDPNLSRADLRVPLQLLVVDSPKYRAKFGLKPDVSESAINGTTRNMQDKVLESRSYPWALVRARVASIDNDVMSLAAQVTLHGMSFDYLVPVQLQASPGALEVTGEFTVNHADFGLQPFSAAGGLLRVAEPIAISFEITASAWPQ